MKNIFYVFKARVTYDDNEQEHGMQRSTLLTNPAMQCILGTDSTSAVSHIEYGLIKSLESQRRKPS